MVDRFFNFVPCGKCHECIEANVSAYEVRCIEEYEKTMRLNGSVFYYTLTLDDAHLPHFVCDYYSKDNVKKHVDIPCFSKYDVQNFMKRLRNRVSIDAFFLSSEYGHKNLRPHYHVVFYCYNRVNPSKFYQSVHDSWKLGFIKPGDNCGLVKSVHPFRYVVKYIQKDILSNKSLRQKGLTSDAVLRYKFLKKECYKRIDIYPFHLQSVGLGSSLLDSLSFDDYVNGYFYKLDALCNGSSARKCLIPLYIMRKKLYHKFFNSKGNVCYILNEFGVEVMRSRLKKQRNDLKPKYIELLKKSDFSKSDVLSNLINVHYGSVEKFKQIFDDSEFLDEFVCYVLLYRGLGSVPFDLSEDFADLRKLMHHRFGFEYVNFDYDVDCFCNFLLAYPLSDYYKDEKLYELSEPYFDFDFELPLSLLNYISCNLKYDSYVKRTSEYNVMQVQRFYKSGVYKSKDIKSFIEFTKTDYFDLCLAMFTKRLPALLLSKRVDVH